MTAAIALIVSYLIGSLSGSLIIGKLRGIDIRLLGSGNAGATNALRTQGKLFALGTIVIDLLKGFCAVLLIARLWRDPNAPYFCALAVVIGHCFPIFFGFRGGKGAGSGMGAMLCLAPIAAAIALIVWLIFLTLSGFVGPSTVAASLAAAVWIILDSTITWPPKITVLAMLWLIVFQHRSNLLRLIRGKEYRFERARIWSRLFKRGNDS